MLENTQAAKLNSLPFLSCFCGNQLLFLSNVCATCLTTTWHNGYWQQDMPRTHMAKSILVRVELRFVLRNHMLRRACIVRWRKITNQGMTLLLEGTKPSESHQRAIEKPQHTRLGEQTLSYVSPLRDSASVCILDCSGICTCKQEWKSTRCGYL